MSCHDLVRSGGDTLLLSIGIVRGPPWMSLDVHCEMITLDVVRCAL